VRAFVFSFQTKLVMALTSVIVLALFLAGSVFVVARSERRPGAGPRRRRLAVDLPAGAVCAPAAGARRTALR
jgi:hypothetical protein